MAFCNLTGGVVDYDGSTLKPGKILKIKKVIPGAGSSSVFDTHEATYKLLAGGTWSPAINVERSATAYVYMEAPGFDADPINGSPMAIPNSASAALGTIAPAVSFPTQVPIAFTTQSFVDTSTDQTVGGNKTFSLSPIVPGLKGSGSSPNAHIFLNTVVSGVLPGIVSIGVPSANLVAGGTLQIQGSDGATLLISDAYVGNNAVVGRRANTSSITPSALSSADTILIIGARGWHSGGGFSANVSAAVSFVASESWAGSNPTTPTAIGTIITFGTTTNGTASRAERWRIEHGGWFIGLPLGANITTTELSSSNQGAIYFKGGKFVLAYNDAGTLRFKTLDLTGTGVTWVHSTTGP